MRRAAVHLPEHDKPVGTDRFGIRLAMRLHHSAGTRRGYGLLRPHRVGRRLYHQGLPQVQRMGIPSADLFLHHLLLPDTSRRVLCRQLAGRRKTVHQRREREAAGRPGRGQSGSGDKDRHLGRGYGRRTPELAGRDGRERLRQDTDRGTPGMERSAVANRSGDPGRKKEGIVLHRPAQRHALPHALLGRGPSFPRSRRTGASGRGIRLLRCRHRTVGHVPGSLPAGSSFAAGHHARLCEDGTGTLQICRTASHLDAVRHGDLPDDWHPLDAPHHQLLPERHQGVRHQTGVGGNGAFVHEGHLRLLYGLLRGTGELQEIRICALRLRDGSHSTHAGIRLR